MNACEAPTRKSIGPVFLLLLAAVTAARPARADVAYHYQDLDPGGRTVIPYGINDSGTIVGLNGFVGANGYVNAFIVKAGVYHEVTVPAGQMTVNFTGVNNAGTVVAQVEGTVRGILEGYSCLYDNGTYYPGYDPNDIYTAVNDDDSVAGYTYDENGVESGSVDGVTYFYPGSDGTQFVGLGSPQNKRVLALGQYKLSGHEHAFIQDLSHMTNTLIDVPGATDTFTTAINRWGTVAGYYYPPHGGSRGFVRLAGGAWQSVDFPGGTETQVYGINDDGALVGNYTTASSYTNGFVATPDGAYHFYDAVDALPYVAGLDNLEGVSDAAHLDADHDGHLTLKDVVIILRKAEGVDFNP